MQLRIPRSRIEYWIKLGILTPEEGELSFEDLRRIRFIQNCQKRQISLKKIIGILASLESGEDSARSWLDELSISYPGVVLKKEGESLVQPDSGQFFLQLDSGEPSNTGRVLSLNKGEVSKSEAVELRLVILEEAYEESIQSQDTGSMRRLLKEILSLDRTHTGAWIELGNLEFERGKLDEAVEYYTKALESDHFCVEAIYNIANIFYKQKKFAASIRAYESCIEMDPDFPESYYNLGILYYELKQIEPSIFFLEEYLDIDPDSIWADRAKEILDLIQNKPDGEESGEKLLPFRKPPSG